MITEDLVELIKEDEGCVLKPYEDTVGVLTIGYGHNLEEGIDQETAEFILSRDLEKHSKELDRHKPSWRELPPNVGMVVLSMQFNMGWNRFSKFVKFWAAIEEGNLQEAARQMEDSRWWDQIKTRGPKLRNLLLSGS